VSKRERVITWADPIAAVKAAMGMTGRQIVEAIRDGRLPEPPMAVLVGFHIRSVEDGRVVMTLLPDESLYNTMLLVHGGAAATTLDTVMGCAIHTMLPATRGLTTLELKINFLRPLRLDAGEVTCTGRLLNLGRQLGFAEGDVKDAGGKLYAHATATYSIFDLPSI
jgi:uncharacterized protein (TIGR00369 family)